MNLKDFKKVSEDNEKAVLKNSKGHSFTIAKKALSKGHLAKLKELPLHSDEGNYVDPNAPHQSDYAAQGAAAQANKESQDREEQQGEQEMQGLEDEESRATNRQMIDQRALKQTSGRENQPMSQDQPAQQPPGIPGLQGGELFADSGLAQPAPEAPQPSAPKKMVAAAPVSAPDIKQHLDDEAMKVANDVGAGHISPTTYGDLFAKRNTLQKIGTLFGLLVAGAGSGLTGQPNAVLQMMNKELENDMDAQKKSADNAQNFLRIHQAKALNEANIGKLGADTKYIQTQTAGQQADNAMKLITLKYVGDTIGKIPDNSPQKGPAVQIHNALKQGVANDINNGNARAAEEAAFVARNNALRMSGNPGLSSIATSNEARHVPGVGDASIPVPQNVREEIISHDKLQKSVGDLLQYSENHTNLIPGTPEYNKGAQKVRIVQQMVRDGLLGTVFRPSEKSLLDAFTGETNPAGLFKMLSTQPKLKELLNANTRESNATKSAYGLPETDGETMQKYGATYKKVDGGWQKVKSK